MSSSKCVLSGGAGNKCVGVHGNLPFDPKAPTPAYSQAISSAAWRFGGTLASAFAMYAAWKYVKPEGMLTDMLGKKISAWARPTLTTVAGLATALSLYGGANSAYRVHYIRQGGYQAYCFKHEVWK